MIEKVCPLLNGPCIGRRCAMSVKLDHYNISAYNVYWVCGLTNDGEMKHRTPNVIASEGKK